MKERILTCNAGSHNTKLAAFDAKTLERKDHINLRDTKAVADWLGDKTNVIALCHRVVHGGTEFTHPTQITDDVLNRLKALVPLAPLHQPAAIKIIETTRQHYPDLPHIACFDTAFHHTMPENARRLPLPQKFHEEGLLRYGFHGLSYQHIANILPKYTGNKIHERIIVAHLGGGASACALKNLKSVDSTMGFSTLDGLMMGTRCGALDAGVLLYLLMEKNMPLSTLSDLLYQHSGLKGVSGISDDMQELLDSDRPSAREAVDLYCTLAAKQIAGLVPALGGLDGLVFTGGIGENAAPIRDAIITHLRWIGDFAVYIIPTNEELVMAQACQAFNQKI